MVRNGIYVETRFYGIQMLTLYLTKDQLWQKNTFDIIFSDDKLSVVIY